MSPLAIACMDGDAAAAREILRNSPEGEINRADSSGFTPLIFGSLGNHLSVVRLLLSIGHGDSSTRGTAVVVNTPKHTALRAAAKMGHTAVAAALLAAGARPNLASGDGATPLQSCARAGHLDVCRLLLAHGADPAHINGFNQTALSLARDRNDTAMVQLMTGGVNRTEAIASGSPTVASTGTATEAIASGSDAVDQEDHNVAAAAEHHALLRVHPHCSIVAPPLKRTAAVERAERSSRRRKTVKIMRMYSANRTAAP